jgi:hypothetical protein
MSIEFERIALYEEVWTTPLIRLAEKYYLSDNGLRKVCKALNIPVPTLRSGAAPPDDDLAPGSRAGIRFPTRTVSPWSSNTIAASCSGSLPTPWIGLWPS